jgi:hypothetical protein
MKNGIFLRDIGEKMYNDGKRRIYYAPASAVIYIVTKMVIAEITALYFLASGTLIAINVSYLLLELIFILGVISLIEYLFGLIILGIGQIAINTAPTENNQNPFVTKSTTEYSGSTAENTNDRTNKKFISPMLVNIIQSAINMDNNTNIIHYLQDSLNRLTKDGEKQVIQHILHAPDDQLRPTLLKVYLEITDPTQEKEPIQ